MLRHLLATLAGVLVPIVLAFGGIAILVDKASAAPSPSWLRPCPAEDSVSCIWDARHRGNGEGRSFIADRDGDVRFLPHRVAHHLLAGE